MYTVNDGLQALLLKKDESKQKRVGMEIETNSAVMQIIYRLIAIISVKRSKISDKRWEKSPCYKLLTKIGKLPLPIRDSPLEAAGKLRDN